MLISTPEQNPVYLCITCGTTVDLRDYHVRRRRCYCAAPEMHLCTQRVAELAQATILVDRALNQPPCKHCGCSPCIGPFCPKL